VVLHVGHVRRPGQQYDTGTRADVVGTLRVQGPCVARNTQVVRRCTCGVHGQMPACLLWRRWEQKVDRLGTGIAHQGQAVVLVFIELAGKALLVRVSPGEDSPGWAAPVDLGVRIECLLTQDRVRAAEGDQATGEARDLLVPFQIVPGIPARLVVLAVGVAVAMLRQVQQLIQQHGRVAVGEHAPVAVGPLRVRRVIPQMAVPQHERDRRHRRARMTAVGLLHRIHGQRVHGMDAAHCELCLVC
jgi:hypothetical protein